MKRFIGQIRGTRAAFTLMEVNLAIFIMAVGVLAMTALYPLGFRESQQAREDVLGAIVANEVLGQLTAVLSSRNIKWSDWEEKIKNAVDVTPQGWFDYLEKKSSRNGEDKYGVRSRSDVTGKAQRVFDRLRELSKNGSPKRPFDNNKYAYGLVAQWGKRILATGPGTSVAVDDHSRVSISFRMARRSGALMAAPLYYTEVHFQGDQADGGN